MEQLVPEVLQDLTSRERKLAVCASPGNLAPADRAEILVLLSTDADEVVAQQALEALRSQPVEAFVEALKRSEALPAIFGYASQHLVGNSAVAEASRREHFSYTLRLADDAYSQPPGVAWSKAGDQIAGLNS